MSPLLLLAQVVLVLVDDLGIDRVGCYGDSDARTPTIDRLAEEGTRFETCWAAPRCSPARAMLMTGLYPFRTGIGNQVQPDFDLDPSHSTLADLFPSGRAHFLGKWHLSHEFEHPALLGYEHLGSIRNLNVLGGDYFRWQKNVIGVAQASITYATTDTIDDAILALGHDFVVVSLNAPHGPFHVPPQPLHTYGEPTEVALRYRAMVEALDTELRRLLTAIDALEGPEPYVIFMSDNGTPGAAAEPGEDPERMKGSHYEGGLRVPMIVRGPGIPVGRVEQRLVSIVDLFATIRDLADCATPDTPDSVPMFGPTPREWIYSETFLPNGFPPYQRRTRSIRNARYKLITKQNPACGPCDEFYDLVADASEDDNLLSGVMSPLEQAAYDALVAALPD